MDVEQVLIIQPSSLAARILADAAQRVAAAQAALVAAQEVPGLLAALSDLLVTAEGELPAAEKRAASAETALADQEQVVAGLRADLDAAPDLPASRQANFTARAALKLGEENLQGAEAHARIAANQLEAKRQGVKELENKLVAVGSLTELSPEVLAVLAVLNAPQPKEQK